MGGVLSLQKPPVCPALRARLAPRSPSAQRGGDDPSSPASKMSISKKENTLSSATKSEVDQVESWREYVSVHDLGCTEEQAAHVVKNPQIDIRRLEVLIRQGCPVEIALDILT